MWLDRFNVEYNWQIVILDAIVCVIQVTRFLSQFHVVFHGCASATCRHSYLLQPFHEAPEASNPDPHFVNISFLNMNCPFRNRHYLVLCPVRQLSYTSVVYWFINWNSILFILLVIIWPSVFLAAYLLGLVEWFYCIHSYLPNMNACTTKSQLMAKKDVKFLPLF